MPAGFQALDGAGNVIAEITDRFSRLVLAGSVVLPFGASFNVNVPGLGAGDEWHVVASGGAYVFMNSGYFTLRPSQTFGFGQTIYYSVWAS